MDDLPTTAQWLKCNYWLYGKAKRPGVINLKTRTLCFLMILNYLNKCWNENHSAFCSTRKRLVLQRVQCMCFAHTFFEMNNNFPKFVKSFHFILKFDDSPSLCICMFNSSGYKIFSTSFCGLAFSLLGRCNIMVKNKMLHMFILVG